MSRGPYTRPCTRCPAWFFTSSGLTEHMDEAHPPPKPVRAHAPMHGIVGLEVLRQNGLRVAALNNSKRRRCDDCGMTSTCAALGVHQRYSGHKGWTEA